MRKYNFINLVYLLLFYTLCSFLPCYSAQTIMLRIPEVSINPDFQSASDTFTQQLQDTAASVNQQSGHPVIGLAPLGGSRINAFKELDLDGLLILDWDRTGSPAAIQKNFTNHAQREKLTEVLTAALNQGAMSTSTVMDSTLSAQILGRLWYELGVSSVRVQFYLPGNSGLPVKDKNIQLWDGQPVGDDDVPLITRFLFDYQGQPKELVYISVKITSDTAARKHALPVDLLRQLAPGKFNWGYFSADGLIFFSKKTDNGLNNGNREFLDALADKAAIVLDYPQGPDYTNCAEPFDGITPMCGRADLETWGLRLVKTLPVSATVFGYSGLTDKDEVRVYAKPERSMPAVRDNTAAATIFSFAGMEQIGDEYEFKIVKNQ